MDEIATLGETYKDDYVLPRDLVVGDTVFLPDTNTNATVIGEKDSKGKVLIQAGIMKMKVPIESVRLVQNPKKKDKPKSTVKRKIESSKTRSSSLEIDLRGFTVDEAVMDIDRFIDNAQLNSMGTFTIIHGKGTGALRSGIHTFLRKHPSVRTFRVGTFGEGENGVTIVELK